MVVDHGGKLEIGSIDGEGLDDVEREDDPLVILALGGSDPFGALVSDGAGGLAGPRGTGVAELYIDPAGPFGAVRSGEI